MKVMKFISLCKCKGKKEYIVLAFGKACLKCGHFQTKVR